MRDQVVAEHEREREVRCPSTGGEPEDRRHHVGSLYEPVQPDQVAAVAGRADQDQHHSDRLDLHPRSLEHDYRTAGDRTTQGRDQQFGRSLPLHRDRSEHHDDRIRIEEEFDGGRLTVIQGSGEERSLGPVA